MNTYRPTPPSVVAYIKSLATKENITRFIIACVAERSINTMLNYINTMFDPVLTYVFG